MPQLLLPLVPDGASQINDRISVVQQNGEWTYFCGVQPIFSHHQDDRASFRMFTAQLIVQAVCRQAEIVRAFGVSANSLKRSVKQYRDKGIASFYGTRKPRGATVITADVTARAQVLFDRRCSRREVAEQLGVPYDTLRKAINQGRLRESPPSENAIAPPQQSPQVCETNSSSSPPSSPPPIPASDKSQRSVSDAAAEMGMACTRPEERVLASLGMLQSAPTRFEDCRDVSFGGVLCALPALTANGLFEHLDEAFPSLSGYYNTLHVVTLLAFMALCRIKTIEQLQYESPGELGKLLGLDRVPEVRCLRSKLARLSENDAPQTWAGLLSKQWLEANPELAGTLYVDGHVRLYHGKQTPLPKRYVSRQRLCLRGTTDYWANDALGRPFFRVERPIDQGLLEALASDIVPRLLKDVPGQPTQAEVDANPYLSRFLIVFDREGYSPVFFKEMWQTHRIACITYRKYLKEDWPHEYFSDTEIKLPSGESVAMKLAEMGVWLGSQKDGLWVREVRKLTENGHQVSLVTTDYDHIATDNAVSLFSRWSQENFFRYMTQHFAIDLLSEYQTEEIPGTNRPVVNPKWRALDSRVRSLAGKLQRRRAEFAAHTLKPEADPQEIPEWEALKSKLLDEVQQLAREWEAVKQERTATPHHLAWDELPADEKFECLAPSRKRLVDTVKMIAYRAETALSDILREAMAREDDSRSLARDLFRSEADLSVDAEADLLQVAIHPMANRRSNRAIEHLLEALNAAEFHYPGTTLKLVYTLVGASNP